MFDPETDDPGLLVLSWSPQNVIMRERISAKVVLCETVTENSSPVEASTTVIVAMCSNIEQCTNNSIYILADKK